MASNNPYLDLRSLAFQSSRTKLGLPPTSKQGEAWGAIMEWGLGEGTATVECQPQSQRTEAYPLPQDGEVRFYFLTDAGIFTAAASEDDLSCGDGPLAKLSEAGQELIAQYRLVVE